MAAGPISPLQPNHKPPPRKPFLLMIIHTSYSSELEYNWSQEPHSGPIQALSHMHVPVQESVPETEGSLRTGAAPPPSDWELPKGQALCLRPQTQTEGSSTFSP